MNYKNIVLILISIFLNDIVFLPEIIIAHRELNYLNKSKKEQSRNKKTPFQSNLQNKG
jgi:hypothetical protein